MRLGNAVTVNVVESVISQMFDQDKGNDLESDDFKQDISLLESAKPTLFNKEPTR